MNSVLLNACSSQLSTLLDGVSTGGWTEVVDLLDALQCLLVVQLQVLEKSVVQVEAPGMDNWIAVLLVALLNSSSLDDILK